METIAKDPEPQIAPRVDTTPVESSSPVSEQEDDDTMSYFQKLANE
jgi:hypothetical protein